MTPSGLGAIGLVLATTGLSNGLSVSGRWGSCVLARDRPVQRPSLPRMSEDDSVGGSDGSPPPPGWDLSVLQQRMAKRQVADMVTAASNWRTGTCEQRTVLVLEDWVRRVRCENGVLACGTYSGEVVLSDLASGEVLQRWKPVEVAAGRDELLEYDGEEGGEGEEDEDEDEDRSEVTALDFDGTHLASGHASGAVYLRQGDRCVMRGELAGVVTGVHWTGGPTAYSSSSDRRLVAWDVSLGKPSFSLVASRPVLCMSVCEGYAALGLDDGSVCVCTLSPLRLLFSFVAHDAPVSAIKLVTVSQLVTACASGGVALWRLDEEESSGRRVTRFEGHRAPVVCLDADAEKIVSGARDGTVRVWDSAGGRLRFMLQGFTPHIGSVQIGPSWLMADGTNNLVLLMDFSRGAAPAEGLEEEGVELGDTEEEEEEGEDGDEWEED